MRSNIYIINFGSIRYFELVSRKLCVHIHGKHACMATFFYKTIFVSTFRMKTIFCVRRLEHNCIFSLCGITRLQVFISIYRSMENSSSLSNDIYVHVYSKSTFILTVYYVTTIVSSCICNAAFLSRLLRETTLLSSFHVKLVS